MRQTLSHLRGIKSTKGRSLRYDEGQRVQTSNLWDLFKTVAQHDCDEKKIVYLRYCSMHYVGYMCKGCLTEWTTGRSNVVNSTHPWAGKLEKDAFALGRLLQRGTYFKVID